MTIWKTVKVTATGSAAALMLAACSGATTSNMALTEIGYSKDALAYEALVKGQLDTAEAQLETSAVAQTADPAWQLNLAHVYAKTGRTEDAARLYRAVIEQRANPMVELSNGEVAHTRALAEMGLARLGYAMNTAN